MLSAIVSIMSYDKESDNGHFIHPLKCFWGPAYIQA